MSSAPSPASPALGGSQDLHRSSSIPRALWSRRVPLFIVHKDQPAANPFIVAVPRFSYLAQLLPRLSSFFGVPCSSFHHEDIQLRNLAVGLLVDLYQPQPPWRLEVGGGDEWDIGDTFLNGVKEVSLPPPSLCHARKRPMGRVDKLTPCVCVIPPLSGRLCSKRKRKANHEPFQRPHDGPVECRPGQ